MTTDARELAKKPLQWSDERIDMVTLALRLADVDRGVLREAYEILHHELVPRIVEAEVDRFYDTHGRYMNDDKRSAILDAPAPSRRVFSEADKAHLRRTVRKVADAVRSDHPDATAAEMERRVRRRLATMSSVKNAVIRLV